MAVFPLAALVFSEAWQSADPRSYARLFHEDGPAEVCQAVFYAMSAVFAAMIAMGLKARSHAGLALLYALFSAIVVVFAMEEISWGQRLAGFEAPQYFALNNMQGEMNLHNLDSIGFDGEFGFVINGLIACAVLYIAFAWVVAPPRSFADRSLNHYVYPSWYFGGYFILPILWSAGLGGPDWLSGTLPHEQEMAETLYASGCLSFMVLGLRRLDLLR